MSDKKKTHAIEYRNYYLPSDFPVLLLTGDNWRLSDVLSESLHFHNCMEIGICQSDSGELHFFNDQVVPFQKGDITCIPRNIPHTTCSSRGTQSKWSYLFFDPKLLFRNAPITSGSPDLNIDLIQTNVQNYLIHSKDAPRLVFLIQVIIEELSLEVPEYMLVKSYLFALFTEMSRLLLPTALPIISEDLPRSRHSNPALAEMNTLSIAPALDFIDENYMNKFPIEYLAELCHLSQTHFRRIFQSIMRVSPLTYLNTVRIMKACNLLRNTNQTILSIAEATGFTTLSNFNRQFSQMLKLSPREFRQKMYQEQLAGNKPIIIEYTGWMNPEFIDNTSAEETDH